MPLVSKFYYRSVFISDLHLGSRGAKAVELLEFLNSIDCDYLYLVGDVIDFWKLQRRSYFPESHRAVVGRIIEMAHGGTKVFYVVGNHDECLRPYLPIITGNIEIVDEVEHVTFSGDTYLVIHGDQFDDVMHRAPWLARSATCSTRGSCA